VVAGGRLASPRAHRLLCGFGSLFISPGRIRKVALALRPSTLLAFHRALVRRKYQRFFSSTPRPQKPGPKGPDQALIQFTRRLVGFGVPCGDVTGADVCRMCAVFWNGRDLGRKVTEFQVYNNEERSHASWNGHTPLTFRHGAHGGPGRFEPCALGLPL
jgi:hypothetical protein